MKSTSMMMTCFFHSYFTDGIFMIITFHNLVATLTETFLIYLIQYNGTVWDIMLYLTIIRLMFSNIHIYSIISFLSFIKKYIFEIQDQDVVDRAEGVTSVVWDPSEKHFIFLFLIFLLCLEEYFICFLYKRTGCSFLIASALQKLIVKHYILVYYNLYKISDK